MKKWLLLFLFFCFSLPSQAAQQQATEALESLMRDENLEIIHSEVLTDGVVDILFGVTVSDFDYLRLVDKLRKHPDIKDVIARTSPRTFCNFD